MAYRHTKHQTHNVLTLGWIGMLIGFAIYVHQSPVNIAISAFFGSAEQGFHLKDSYLFRELLHDRGQQLIKLLFLFLVFSYVICLVKPKCWSRLKASLNYVLLTWLTSVLIVALVKHYSALPCPWDIQQFGGDQIYLGLASMFTTSEPLGKCFPSGHASGVYGLLGIGYVAMGFKSNYRAVVAGVLLLGATYGGVQIARGAHFLSHDLFTIAICWSTAWLLSHRYFKQLQDISLQQNQTESNNIFIHANSYSVHP